MTKKYQNTGANLHLDLGPRRPSSFCLASLHCLPLFLQQPSSSPCAPWGLQAAPTALSDSLGGQTDLPGRDQTVACASTATFGQYTLGELTQMRERTFINFSGSTNALDSALTLSTVLSMS
jgi:hypothetical protein